MGSPLLGVFEGDPSSLDVITQLTRTTRELERYTLARFPTVAARNAAMTAIGGPQANMVCATDDIPGVITVWNTAKGAWRVLGDPPMRCWTTWVGLSFSGGVSGETTVTFPAGRFVTSSESARIVATAQLLVASDAAATNSLRVYDLTATGCKIRWTIGSTVTINMTAGLTVMQDLTNYAA